MEAGLFKSEPDINKSPVIVTVDLTRDIINLNETVAHFYKLFDNAYGSNNEKLFETSDLEQILELFKDAIDDLKHGEINAYTIGGNAVELQTINSVKVKNNLIQTNQNINALKVAYVRTADMIKKIVRVINSKEMMMLSSMGVQYKMLASATYEQLKRILETIPDRLKDAKKLENNLTKMENSYKDLTKELMAMQRSMSAVSTVTFDTIYNRRMMELSNSANYMSQAVTLRLAGIGLYVKELKDVRDALVMLSNINTIDRKDAEELSKKLSELD